MRERDPDEFSVRQWPDWDFWKDGRGNRRGRSMVVAITSLSSLFLIARIAEIDGRADEPLAGTAIAFALGYCVSCLLGPWFGPLASRKRRIAIVAAMFTLGGAPALLLATPAYLTDLTYAIAVGLMVLPLRLSLPLGSAVAVGQIGWMQLRDGRVEWGPVATLVLVTAGLGIVFALNFTIGQLRAAREQVRRMAVTQERERVARDLHDVLGHSLSTMTVKLSLARRILESATDPAPALTEIRDLETLSRQTLTDVRATVSGYRTVSLANEIAGAGVALRAAGVLAELPTAADEVRSELQGVFGYVVREAVTNVLRHSDARACRVRLGRDWVEITDDGTLSEPLNPGQGLTGLAERLASVSGTLEYGKSPGGFRLIARGPSHGEAGQA
ncbi:sensor histidine kinase [Amycolatopsis thailandensis]|uniref:sensor histidine kinase n=1 Tax=Amycolatopsis thailandensis TaxID=589330 RepID=UPI001FC9ABCD|nr:histidine kinase [Amycolatopsis thailandensis]